jgi:hypothetical protein
MGIGGAVLYSVAVMAVRGLARVGALGMRLLNVNSKKQSANIPQE